MEPARTRAVVLRRGAVVLGWMVFMSREVLVKWVFWEDGLGLEGSGEAGDFHAKDKELG